MLFSRNVFVVSTFILLSACAGQFDRLRDIDTSEIGATKIGAATGGVMGASLGAIVGNQTGSAGSGMFIGALAGTGTGAMIGHAIEGQQDTIRAQDEVIERQGFQLRAQKKEIEELRRVSQDSVGFSDRGAQQSSSLPATRTFERQPAFSESRSSAALSAPLSETLIARQSSSAEVSSGQARIEPSFGRYVPKKDAPQQQAFGQEPEVARGALGWQEPSRAEPLHVERSLPPITSPDLSSNECQRAAEEARKAEQAGEIADKLFHYRRALRLCPESPAHHNGLGEVYLSLNRYDDANYEFQEALKRDPTFRPALENIRVAREMSNN